MKRGIALVLLIGFVCFVMTGCGVESSDNTQRRATEAALKEAHSQIGMPALKNYQERKLAKMLFELRDQVDLVCYAYIVNLEGKLIFIGKCVGYGLPYSVQYTNPMKRLHSTSGVTLPQADPNGLFMPSGLSATWLMMMNKEGVAEPVYIEPEIIVSPFPLHQE